MNPKASEVAHDVADFLRNMDTCYTAMAERLVDLGVYLACRQCGTGGPLTKGMAVDFLHAKSWPEHCGQTMELRR
jgi:hypothetical protein